MLLLADLLDPTYLCRHLDGRNGSRAKYGGYDAIDVLTGENREGRDCQGHGTHCAGIAGGLYSGVAKDANLFSIRYSLVRVQVVFQE